MLHRCYILCLPLLLVGCSQFGLHLEPEPASTVAAPAPAETPPAPDTAFARHTVDDDVRELLKAAEAALAADRLTTPIHDNAFDRFQAVLLLRPGNEQAESGLQQIFARYVGMVRGALAAGNLDSARVLMERARLVNRDNPMLADLEVEMDAVRQQLARTAEKTDVADEKEILLNVENLDRRSEAVVAKLQKLASQVKETDETLLIVARNDAEGRWIYQRMSEGVPHYRLRGDIQLGRIPKILLLPPIDQKL